MKSDEEHSKLLDAHLREGESQTLEFKEAIPQNTLKLAENIASFATSNQGTIYIGIKNSGDVIGLQEDIDSVEARDALQRRIIGIVQKIEPRVRVGIDFIKKDSNGIIRITVPKGSEPIYYVGNMPYLRDLSTSRVAKPNEVTEIHRKYLQNQVVSLKDDKYEFFHRVLISLTDINLALSDIEIHLSNPNLTQLQYDLGNNGDILLQLSTDSNAKSLNVDEKFKELAMKLGHMKAYRFYLGKDYYDKFIEHGKDLLQLVQPVIDQIKKKLVITYSKTEYKEILESAIDDLKVNWEIGKKRNARSDLEKLRDKFRMLGYKFNRLAILPESEKYEIQPDLFELAKRLRALSTPTVFGLYAIGFNNIRHITPAVEGCIRMGEAIIKFVNTR